MDNCLIRLANVIGECILTHCLLPLIQPHIDYWWCFDSNIQDLRTGTEGLKNKIGNLREEIHHAKHCGNVVRPWADEWLKTSTKMLEEAEKILSPHNIPKACNLISRYSSGKIAKVTAEEIAKHVKSRKASPIDFLQVESLAITFESTEQVFPKEITDDNKDGCFEFPRLKQLTLERLPNSASFFQGLEYNIIKFPKLTKMSVELQKRDSETRGFYSNPKLHFVCDARVKIDSLNNLTVKEFGDNISDVWCSEISDHVFKNLKTLNVFSMNGIKSLMSSAIAKKLEHLRFLTIQNCTQMTEVIERNYDDNQEVDITLFPLLRELKMENLDNLRSFWQCNHELKLPLLEIVEVLKCSNMETFTPRAIKTPIIKTIKVNNKQIDCKKDLNSAMRSATTSPTFLIERRVRKPTERETGRKGRRR